jgi:hypothetical protein
MVKVSSKIKAKILSRAEGSPLYNNKYLKIPYTGIFLVKVEQVHESGSAWRFLPGFGSAQQECGSTTNG